MFSIGLIGGIASGKSTVARLLENQGAVVVDADAIVHELYGADGAGSRAVSSAFGKSFLKADGAVDRAALGALVFRDAVARDRLSHLVWPLVRERIVALQAQARADDVAVFVLEAPLLLEAGWRDLVDAVWLVRAPVEAVRRRLGERNGLTPEAAQARIDAQPSDDERAKHADVVIDNANGLAELETKVVAALKSATEEPPSRL